MKTEKITWGIILVFVGAILLLDNLGIINFYWRVIWHYWPVLLILAGINILFSRGTSSSGGIIIILATCIMLAFIAYSGINYRNSDRLWWRNSGEEVSFHRNSLTDNIFTEEFFPGTTRAELNITGGATFYKLNDSTVHLFNASVKKAAGNYSLKKLSRNGVEILNFKMDSRKMDWESDDREVLLQLNKFPVWDIHIKIGAGEAELDLSKFKIQDLSFEGGAASFKVKLGEPQSITNVTVKTGVSDIGISIPESAGCQIRIKSGLSAKNFDGFKEQPDGTYVTPNFNSATRKIMINFNGGMSDFEVKRY